MAFMLANVVPWGRSFEEYVALFNLTATDLDRKILSCGDGPAGFNAEMTRQGKQVVSIDPVYQFTAAEIRDRINATFDEILQKVAQNRQEFVWDAIPSPEALGQVRMAAMETFLQDFETGKAEDRYLALSLPDLPFPEDAFDLALCSHFLFLYSPQLDADFHIAAVKAMLRVAPEVRIFPLLELGSKLSRHLGAVKQFLEAAGYPYQVVRTEYEFQKGGNEMLQIFRS